MQYEYMVAYNFSGGNGRAFLTRTAPIISSADVIEVEKALTASSNEHINQVAVYNFQLLRTYEAE